MSAQETTKTQKTQTAPKTPKPEPTPEPEENYSYDMPEVSVEPVNMGPEVVATTLAPQLGSDAEHLSRGAFDMRKLSVIEEKDIPLLIYAKIRGKKTAVWHTIYDEFLNCKVSVGGRGRKDIIRMEGVSKGGLPDYQTEFEQPGWFARNFTQRDWRKKAKDEML